ncbi:hypothetical protein Stsp01_66260 [Streptomyces sp. NBRC 13847]|uniref:hypothetical protein n=1 Tax=Streptomyces TaxID=1883 RepID=UPI0024A5902D|nr:hypothetical protein [Streptomyces sp. NBRC 13847]GLW19883.1 hypothetical protein Stsp01_66260 [Streptomyces sp. NBRC 13847]
MLILLAKVARQRRRFGAEIVPPPVREPAVTPVRVWERTYGCCAVERVRGWLGETVIVTVVHQEQCPVWSRR